MTWFDINMKRRNFLMKLCGGAVAAAAVALGIKQKPKSLDFREWVKAHGPYTWSAGDKDLSQLMADKPYWLDEYRDSDKHPKYVVVTEGEFEAASLHAQGIPAVACAGGVAALMSNHEL